MDSGIPALKDTFGIAAGQLVVATMMHSVAPTGFEKSVILLLRHDDRFTLGVDLTRVNELYPYSGFLRVNPEYDLLRDHEDRTVYCGGPVDDGTLYPGLDPQTGEIGLVGGCHITFLHDTQTGPPSAHPVQGLEGVSYSTTLTEELKDYRTCRPKEIKILVGYTGWGPGSLAAEMDGVFPGLPGAGWAIVPATHDLVFGTDREKLWDRCADIAGISRDVPELKF